MKSGRSALSIWLGLLGAILCCGGVASAAIRTAVDAGGSEWIEYTSGDGDMTIRDLVPASPDVYTQYDIDPGYVPEGDYLGWAAFTRSGDRLIMTNRMTDNVTVFDWSTMEVLQNVDVGDYPAYLAVTDSQAFIGCVFSDDIYVLNLNTYAVDTIFTVPAGQQPWVIRLSPDDAKMYVACDISNTVEVFDLAAGSHVLTISDFPIGLSSFGFNSENGRNTVTFSNFEITPDGLYLIAGNWDDSLYFFNTATGAIDHALGGLGDVRFVALSGDSTTAVVFTMSATPAVVYQIDLSTFTVTSSVTLTGLSISMAYEIGVNYDGSKAFVGVSGNQSAIVRFDTHDFITFSSTYTPFWIGTSPDHSLAISGQYRFSIIDFNSETVLGQHVGNSQASGAVAPVGARAAGFDAYRHEGVYFYDYTTTNPPAYRGSTISGLVPEGDAPRRVAITPDGGKAIVSNVLSDNITIVDLDGLAVDTIIEDCGERVQDVAVTSDGQWAVACGMDANTLKVIDLTTRQIAASVYTGTRPGIVAISPGDTLAYVGNIVSNSVSVVRLAGAASYKVTDIPCGVIGVVWAGYGVSSDIEVTADGAYCLVAASFDDQVNVIDAGTNAVVATLNVGDFPIQIACDTSGAYATVTNGFDDTYSVLHVNGGSSSVVNTFSYGDYPLRLAYNPVYDQVGIGHYSSNNLVHADARTGVYQGVDYYNGYGPLAQVLFDEDGEPIVLTLSTATAPGHLHRGVDVIPLPATPAFFDYSAAADRAVVVMPGPDWVTVVDWGTGVAEVRTMALGSGSLHVMPNPFQDQVTAVFINERQERVMMTVYDRAGRRVKSVVQAASPAGINALVWDGTDDQGRVVDAGAYFLEVETPTLRACRKVLFLR